MIDSKYVDKILEGCFNNEDDVTSSAAKYALFNGGKRLRPSLLLSAAKTCSGEITPNAEKLACAIELIHNYSLIHDDLPCMDDDDYRRGQLSCHKKFGEAAAILAGDYLLNLAAEVAFSGDFSQPNYLRACRFLFNMSGGAGMIHGQTLDIFDSVFSSSGTIALYKTAYLIRAALVCGSLVGGMEDEYVDTVDCIAKYLGICYQIADDCCDLLQDHAASDNYHNLDSSIAEFAGFVVIIQSLLDKLPYDFSFVNEVVDGLKQTIVKHNPEVKFE